MRREESSTQQLDSLKRTYQKLKSMTPHTHISSDIAYKPDLQKDSGKHSTHMPQSPQKALL